MKKEIIDISIFKIQTIFQEQKWIIAIICLMNGFIISESDKLNNTIGKIPIIIGFLIITLAAILFLIIRQLTYLKYSKPLNEYYNKNRIEEESLITNLSLKHRKSNNWSGTIIFIIIIVGLSFISFYKLCQIH